MAVKPTDVVTVGQAIYKEKIRDTLGPEHKGKLVVIDVESGDYEIDLRQADATRRLLARRPGAITYTERVGYPTAYTLGFRFDAPASDQRHGKLVDVSVIETGGSPLLGMALMLDSKLTVISRPGGAVTIEEE